MIGSFNDKKLKIENVGFIYVTWQQCIFSIKLPTSLVNVTSEIIKLIFEQNNQKENKNLRFILTQHFNNTCPHTHKFKMQLGNSAYFLYNHPHPTRKLT